VPIFADREHGELRMRLASAVHREPPAELRQQARESW
jgi:hypothetical protein